MSEVTIQVYTNEGCWPCKKTKDKFNGMDNDDNIKVPFIEVNADTPENKDFLKNTLGFTTAPVVTITNEAGVIIDKWAGLRPDKIAVTIKNYGKKDTNV